MAHIRHKASRFNIVEMLPGGMVGIYNTLTRSLSYHSGQEWERLTDQGGISGRFAKEAADQGLLIEKDVDEDLVLAKWRSIRRRNPWLREYQVRVGTKPVTANSRGEDEKMGLPEARRVLKGIFRDLESSGPKRVRLDFIGADSSRNPEAVLFIAEGLSGFYQSSRICFSCGINVTGEEHSDSLIKTMMAYGLDRVRLVCAEPIGGADIKDVIHRKTSVIENLPDDLELEILIAYDDRDKSAVRALKLVEGLRPGDRSGNAQVRFGLVLPETTDRTPMATVPCLPSCLSDTDLSRLFYLREKAEAGGFGARLLEQALVECPARSSDGACFRPDGSMRPCPSGSISHIYHPGRLPFDLPDECRKTCPFGPLCDGGCLLRAKKIDATGALVHCRKRELNRVIRESIIKKAPEHEIDSK